MKNKIRITERYQNIIWDWNGTLLNDSRLCVEIVSNMLRDHSDFELNLDTYRNVFGFPIEDYYKKIGMDFQKESFEELTVKFISNYDKMIKDCNLHDETKQTLQSFQKAEVNQFILTAAHKESVLELLDHFSIDHHFTEVEGLDNHRGESKVDRGIHLVEKNEIKRETTVLIGDTDHDYEVAQEMGIDCILIANGHQSKSRLEQKTKGRIQVLDNMGELFG